MKSGEGRVRAAQILSEVKILLANGGKCDNLAAAQSGYSLMVKLQPSKLIMRVRFPLPALFQPQSSHMKVISCLAMALVGGLFAFPVQAAGLMLDKAVTLAAIDSEASLSDICLAAYEAGKEAPNELDKVFESILNQRTTWKASEVYAIMRAVLMARPDLMQNLSEHAASYTRSTPDKNGKAVHEAAPELNPIIYRLLNVLHVASLEEGVAENALNIMMCVASGVYENAVNAAHSHIGINTNLIEGVIPTPGPVSPQN